MAAYAALVSLMHTIQQLINHPRPPISLDEQQVHSLTQNLTFLQDFLERYSSSEEEELESRIAGAAYAAEDVIESHIADQIHAGKFLRSFLDDQEYYYSSGSKDEEDNLESYIAMQLMLDPQVMAEKIRSVDKLTGQQCDL